MNWYKQSLALPRVENEYPDPNQYSGLSYLDQVLTPEHAEKLSEPGLNYLASGFYGSAFTFNDKDIVKKYTSDEVEARTAQNVLKKQTGNQPLSGVVFVYSVKDLSEDILVNNRQIKKNPRVRDRHNTLFEITIEKVTTLSWDQKKIFSDSFWSMYNYMRESPNLMDFEIINYLFKKDRKDFEYDFLHMLIEFIRVLNGNNYTVRDIHENNLGIRNQDTIVILDLGSIEI